VISVLAVDFNERIEDGMGRMDMRTMTSLD
jgi:hypothetical protein